MLLTGVNQRAWASAINRAVGEASKPPPKNVPLWKAHGTTNVDVWVQKIARMVVVATQKEGARRGILMRRDGNMASALALALALAGWVIRLQRAKAYDPRRPIRLRKLALDNFRHTVLNFCNLAIDESWDHEVWSGQHWDPPHSPHAVDGVFE